MCKTMCPARSWRLWLWSRKAKEMATAVGVVSEAARSMSTAQEDASVVSEAALQAAAALSSMDPGQLQCGQQRAQLQPAQREGSTLEAHERERKKAETESFALGGGGIGAGPADGLQEGCLQNQNLLCRDCDAELEADAGQGAVHTGHL